MNRSVLKDPIWGEIAVLPWEKTLLNSSAFNRLHNIIQNSNGFRVYPALSHSRFLHSIGVMHVATRLSHCIYRNHFTMSGKVSEKSGFPPEKTSSSLLKEINEIRDSYCGLAKPDSVVTLANDIRGENFDWHLHRDLYPAICSIRIAALLHDVGHLPYSHIFEGALEIWFDELPENHHIKKCFAHGKAFHEQIGEWVMEFIRRSDLHTNDDPRLVATTTIAKEILHTNRFPIHKSFISGVIDADHRCPVVTKTDSIG